jgi:hypothetical protein
MGDAFVEEREPGSRTVQELGVGCSTLKEQVFETLTRPIRSPTSAWEMDTVTSAYCAWLVAGHEIKPEEIQVYKTLRSCQCCKRDGGLVVKKFRRMTDEGLPNCRQVHCKRN